MPIAQDLVTLVERAATTHPPPPIREVYVADQAQDEDGNSNFGFLVLDDDTVGLTYVGMDDTREEVNAELARTSYRGTSPLDMAQMYLAESAWQRALGMAAVNAASQFEIRRSGRPLPEVGHTVDLLQLQNGDHVGMVGYFPPLVDRIGALGFPLTVIELDDKWLGRGRNLEVTLDPSRLAVCNKVLCTGTTLVNQTLDAVLSHAGSAEAFMVIGPTAGCLPEPLFERGVTTLCGCQVTDCRRFVELWSTGQRWRAATHRYLLEK